jgi:predicted SnoaL-like aldol condensation-catalyzing enzyme
MSSPSQLHESVNPKTGMTHSELRKFVRDHFEEFVNRKNLQIGKVNFAPEFVDHGADVPPGLPPGPEGAIAYVGGAYKKFPNIHVDILDLIAEDDKIVVRKYRNLAHRASPTRRTLGLPNATS